MSITLMALGFILAGAAVGGAILVSFWDEIKSWLNSVAADAVERHLGYSARNRIQKATAAIDRVVSKLKNTSTVYTKQASSDCYFDKTTLVMEADCSDFSPQVLGEIRKHGDRVVQEFNYIH